LFVEIVSVPELLKDPVPKLIAPPLHWLPLPEAEIVPLPFTVPLASVKSPLIVSGLLTVSVPPHVLSMSTAVTLIGVSMIAVPNWLSLEVNSTVLDAPGRPADQLPALLQLSFPPDLAEAPVQ
jgi:hypothetical protein